MRQVPTLIDTGPIVASLNRSDPHHVSCSQVFKELLPRAFTCWPVITETAYLLGDWSPASARLFTLIRTRTLEVLTIDASDIDRIEEILAKYSDQQFQFADACLMYLAERENIKQVITLDRKDFGLFRTTDGGALDILP